MDEDSIMSLPLRSLSQADVNSKGDLPYKDDDEEAYELPPRSQSEANFRTSFLSRLSYENVWVPVARRSPKHQTLIIFDWDDTLLCTSFLRKLNQDRPLTPTMDRHLRLIESAAQHLLELAIPMGQTFIITNAMDGWVQDSAARYLPGLMPILERVQIISARSTQEAYCDGDVQQWKLRAFLEVGRRFDSEVITNLISVGDSNFELIAAHALVEQFTQGFLKTIKLKEGPSSEELVKELDLLAPKFGTIVQKACNMKVCLQKTSKPS